MEKFGIYIHIPFCKKKCKYCDFISFCYGEKEWEKYFEALIKEIEYIKVNKKVSTIYIGGGTPSLVDSKYIRKVMEAIRNKFEINEDAEITIEVNPGTVIESKLLDYKNLGINRLSIGLQAVQDRLLNLIGRIHGFKEFEETYKLAQKVGFKNINVDLMLAIPTQTEEELIESIDKIIPLNPNHISVYSLILEEGTVLEKEIKEGKLELLDEDLERKMYWKAKKILEKNGYIHYEISNFAKKGFESKHNVDCWNQEEYIGFGLAAHSYLNSKRFSNTNNFTEYVKNIESGDFEKNVEVHESQTRESKAKEFMMLGLRKIQGVSISEFERRFRINPLFYFRFEIEKLDKEGLIEVDLDNIKLTKKGLDLANLVFEEFV